MADHLTFTLSPGMAPAAPIMRLLSRFNREKVEAFAEISIAFLDLIDGDPDSEESDEAEEDDPSGQCDEDCHNTQLAASFRDAAGCPISDPGEFDDGL